jgi:hypothetical protein
MFIVWGTRRTERILGYVADFCPVCRETRAFRLVRVGLVSHIYYISFGSGKHVGHLMHCEECASSFDTDATRYVTFEKQRPVHLSELVQTTFPTLQTAYATQLAQEAEIRRAPRALSPAQRAPLLVEPFRLLHGTVEARYANGTQMDKPAGIGCLATTVLTIGIVAIAIYLKGTLSDNVLIAVTTIACLGGLYTFIQLCFAPGRFLRRQVIPQLARALDPLQPDESELTETLKKCRDIGWKIGSKMKPRQILAEIERRRANARQGI